VSKEEKEGKAEREGIRLEPCNVDNACYLKEVKKKAGGGKGERGRSREGGKGKGGEASRFSELNAQ
jgi:hypothetical protein